MKLKVLKEIKRIQKYYQLDTVQQAMDYIMKHPYLVNRDIYKIISNL